MGRGPRYIETHCHNCRGRGYERRQRTRAVTIPAGNVNDGMQVRITGEGDTGANGGPPGNLYVQVRVQDHELFARDDEDLVLRMGVNIAEAALGSSKQIPTLDGEEVDLEIPAGTQSGRGSFGYGGTACRVSVATAEPPTGEGISASWWT